MAELLRANLLPHPDAKTINGKTMGENCNGKITWDPRVIKTAAGPVMHDAGFLHLTGNLFDSAIMKSKLSRVLQPDQGYLLLIIVASLGHFSKLPKALLVRSE